MMISTHDPIHGTIEVAQAEIKLIDSRPFQRLRHIEQLGFCELAFPGCAIVSTVRAAKGPSMTVPCPLFSLFPSDLGLTADSPAVDAGIDTGETYVGSAPDLGAFELGDDGRQPTDPNDPPPGSKGEVGGCDCRSAPIASVWLFALALPLSRQRRRTVRSSTAPVDTCHIKCHMLHYEALDDPRSSPAPGNYRGADAQGGRDTPDATWSACRKDSAT